MTDLAPPNSPQSHDAARRLRWFFGEWWAEVCLIADEMLEVVWPVK